MKKPVLALLLALALVAGCSSPEKEMKPFVGRPSSELVTAWGVPQDKSPDDAGGEIWTYVKRHVYTTSAYTENHTSYEYGGGRMIAKVSTTYTPSRMYMTTSIRKFYIDPAGTIYKFSWQGR